MTENRKIYLDTVGGFLLCYMILHHCSQSAGLWPDIYKHTYWLGFFMPWFFFKGGLFHKIRPTKDTIKSGYKRLVIPFIWFSIIGTVVLWLDMILSDTLTLRYIVKTIAGIFIYGSFYGNLALWFLLSLFAVRVIFNLCLSKYLAHDDRIHKVLWGGVITIASLFFIPFHYFLTEYNINYYPLYLSNISSGLAFYFCGYILRDFKLSKVLTIFIIGLYVLIEIYIPVNVGMRSGDSTSPLYLYPLWIPFSIIAIITFNEATKHFFNNKNILSSIGENTMPYYCMHVIIINIINFAVEGLNIIISRSFYLIILIIANIMMLPIFTFLINKSRFKFILG